MSTALHWYFFYGISTSCHVTPSFHGHSLFSPAAVEMAAGSTATLTLLGFTSFYIVEPGPVNAGMDRQHLSDAHWFTFFCRCEKLAAHTAQVHTAPEYRSLD